MTPERIAELRRLAEAATPGASVPDQMDYLAATVPATLLELLAEIERLQLTARIADADLMDANKLRGELMDHRREIASELSAVRADRDAEIRENERLRHALETVRAFPASFGSSHEMGRQTVRLIDDALRSAVQP